MSSYDGYSTCTPRSALPHVDGGDECGPFSALSRLLGNRGSLRRNAALTAARGGLDDKPDKLGEGDGQNGRIAGGIEVSARDSDVTIAKISA